MRLLELHIDGFGKFHDRTISFDRGLNVVYGKNEAGKSTLHTFIRGMLFGIERGRGRASKKDLYSKYEPWENSGTYEGWLRLESDGTVYRIERRFRKDDKALRIINETAGLEEEPTKALWDKLLCGLNETTYNNTISIGQLKSATEDGMIGELKNYIANMNNTGNLSLNITKAMSFLKDQRRSLEAGLVPDASRTYTALLSEIRDVEAEISSPQYENQLVAFQNMRARVKGTIEMTQAEKTDLDAKIQNGRQVLSNNQFTDRSSVTAYAEKCKGYYEEYCLAEKECLKKSRKVITVLSVILAVCGLAGGGYMAVTNLSSYLPFVLGAAGFSMACFILAIVLNGRSRKFKESMEKNKGLLSEIFEKHLSNPSISEEAMKAFESRMDEFTSLCDMISRSEEELKKYMEDINTLQQKQNTCNELIEKQQKTQWELEKKLEHLNNCKNKATALKHVLAENDKIRTELSAIDLARETMTELSSSIRNSFGFYLNKEASRQVNGITGGIYDSMSVDENLNVFLNTKRKLVPLESVSSGTMDQVYLALRLSAAKLLTGDGEPLPLIFDDSFTQYDDDRLRTALQWLSKSYGSQAIIFTCHRREAQMLRAHQVPFNLIEI